VLRPAERETLDRVLDRLERRSGEIFARSDAWRDIVRAPAAEVGGGRGDGAVARAIQLR
jgi:hypothetical protein